MSTILKRETVEIAVIKLVNTCPVGDKEKSQIKTKINLDRIMKLVYCIPYSLIPKIDANIETWELNSAEQCAVYCEITVALLMIHYVNDANLIMNNIDYVLSNEEKLNLLIDLKTSETGKVLYQILGDSLENDLSKEN